MTVNMDKDYEDLYTNLDSLLKDICRFLEANSLQLSPADKKEADALIERSKIHLQIIEKFSSGNENGSSDVQRYERYVDMTKKTVVPQRPLIVEPPLYEAKCPFQDLPAKDASQETKYGTLSKRRRVLNILDLSTKVYAVIHENWLLIYNSRKDLKPDCTFDLKQYEAKEDETEPNLAQFETTKEDSVKKNTFNLKMTSSFKVFHSSSLEKKSYSFVATTHKDMLQWVVNINRRHDKAVLPTKQMSDEQNYEVCQDFQDSIEEENIYNEIEMPCRRPLDLHIPQKVDCPAIPEKRPMVPSKNVPSPISRSTSTESMEIYEELENKVPVHFVSEKCSLSSFATSDDDEDQTYYELDTIKDNVNGQQGLEAKKINFDVPPTSLMPKETAKTVDDDDEDTTYENGLSPQTTQLPNKAVSPSVKNKLPTQMESNADSKTVPPLPDKNSPKPLAPKPKILSPKPWKPFNKKMTSKNSKSPQVSKNKSIGEGLKSPLKLENKSSLGEPSCKDVSPTKSSSSSDNDSSKTSNDISPSKPHQGSSIVKIIRNRWSTSQSPSCSLETFSRNTKIETFQASPTKESPTTDFLRSPTPTKDLNDSLRPIATLISDLNKNSKCEDEKPMVLLNTSLENEDSLEKLKKSPVVPVKPKKWQKK